MRLRSVLITLSVTASVLVLFVNPAGASVNAAGPRGDTVRPAARIIDDVLNGVSCTTQPDNPAITSACVAVGFFADAPNVAGLLEFSTNGKWFGNTFGSLQGVTDPLAVSCVPQQADIPACVAVGEHFRNPKFPAQLIATGSANGFSPVVFRNPKGATWSDLAEVSCVTTTFCMLVGSAGTTRKTAHGLRYLSHATAYRWTGSAHRLKVPAPAHARFTELASVSCATETSCLAVGNYVNARGRSRPYSALWTSGVWHVHAAKIVAGKTTTTFEGVSCAAPASCVAVGEAVKPGRRAFAEQFSAGGWTMMRIPAVPKSALFSVSCPATTFCAAVGHRGTRPLAEVFSGSKWATKAVPATSAPFTSGALFHVSCVTATICTAVGYRHNPNVRFSFRTLAVGWNGSAWKIQKTINQ